MEYYKAFDPRKIGPRHAAIASLLAGRTRPREPEPTAPRSRIRTNEIPRSARTNRQLSRPRNYRTNPPTVPSKKLTNESTGIANPGPPVVTAPPYSHPTPPVPSPSALVSVSCWRQKALSWIEADLDGAVRASPARGAVEELLAPVPGIGRHPPAP